MLIAKKKNGNFCGVGRKVTIGERKLAKKNTMKRLPIAIFLSIFLEEEKQYVNGKKNDLNDEENSLKSDFLCIELFFL